MIRVIEKRWHYRNMQCSVVFNTTGNRCGYVIVPAHIHIPIDPGYDDVLIHCHGGVTLNKNMQIQQGGGRREFGVMVRSGVTILGFDCAHIDDALDSEKVAKLFDSEAVHLVSMLVGLETDDAVKRDLPYCESVCRSMVDQLIALGGTL